MPGRIPIPIIPIGPPWCIIIGGGGSPWIIPGPMFVGGGIATPVFGGGPWANGFDAILPALKAAVVASMRCWAWLIREAERVINELFDRC